MSAPYRVRLRTIAARQLWDGRKARGGRGFIPGIRHFQAGVCALHKGSDAGNVDAADRLGEIEAAVESVERFLARWRRGLAGFAAELPEFGSVRPNDGSWVRASRSFRIRARETRRLARLIAAYDSVCAETVAVTAAASRAGVFNPHHEAVTERGRLIRAVIALGHRGPWARVRNRVVESGVRGASRGAGGPGHCHGAHCGERCPR